MSSFPSLELMTPEQREAFLNGPAQRPPDGVTPNLVNPSNRNDIAIGVTIACIIITSVCVTLRGYSQIHVKKSVKFEDGLGLLAFGAFCGIIWTSFELQRLNMFWNHQWNISVLGFVDILFILYVWPCCYAALMLFAKPAILLEWNRIFVPRSVRNKFWWTCVALIALNALFYAASFVAIQFYCTPHQRIWKRWITGTCRDRRSMDAPSAVFNLLLDILILLLPQRVIWTLQLTKSKKIGISFIFGVGILAVFFAGGRVYGVLTLDYAHDVTYHVGSSYIWSLAECTCVMMVFCVPAIPKVFVDSSLVNKILSSLRSITVPIFGTSRGTTGASSSHGSRNSRWRGASIPNILHRGKMDEEANNSQVRLANLSSTRLGSGTEQANLHIGRKDILRMTEISTETSKVPVAQSTDWIEHSRPWEVDHSTN